MNLSKFKKIKDDNNVAILAHPDGHKIEIQKNSLSKKHSKQLKGLPLHMDVGGAVPDEGSDFKLPEQMGPEYLPAEPAPLEPSQPQWVDPMQAQLMSDRYNLQTPGGDIDQKLKAAARINREDTRLENIDRYKAQNAQKEESQDLAKINAYNQMAAQKGWAPMSVPAQVADAGDGGGLKSGLGMDTPSTNISGESQVTTPADTFGYGQYGKDIQSSSNQYLAGLKKEAEAQSILAKQTAQIEQQAQAERQKVLDSFNVKAQELEQQNEKLQQAAMNGKIDPSRFWNNKSTAGKISTAIGLILGGIGGGMTGRGNVAEAFLQKQIDADINAQKADMDKNQNLLSYNMRRLGNLKDATAMTISMQQDQLASRLRQAAAAVNDPMAKARFDQAAGQWGLKAAELRRGVAMNQAMMGMMTGGSQGAPNQQNPGMVIRMIVPEPQQSAAYKELGEAHELIKNKESALSAFDKASKLQSVGGRLANPIQAGKQIDALMDPMIMELAKDTAGKFSEMEFETLSKALKPKILDDEQTLSLKRNKLVKMFNKKLNTPILSTYGINLGVEPHNRFDETGKPRLTLGAPIRP